MFWSSANFTASSVGNAMAFTPDLIARMSVSLLCLPLGLMQPRTSGVSGNIVLAVTITLAMSRGVGGLAFSISVPCMGMKAITTRAEGLY